jgi:hypothetical protein
MSKGDKDAPIADASADTSDASFVDDAAIDGGGTVDAAP